MPELISSQAVKDSTSALFISKKQFKEGKDNVC